MTNRIVLVMTAKFSKFVMRRAGEVRIWFIFYFKRSPTLERWVGAMAARCFPVDMQFGKGMVLSIEMGNEIFINSIAPRLWVRVPYPSIYLCFLHITIPLSCIVVVEA